jgi:hypothetical protein
MSSYEQVVADAVEVAKTRTRTYSFGGKMFMVREGMTADQIRLIFPDGKGYPGLPWYPEPSPNLGDWAPVIERQEHTLTNGPEDKDWLLEQLGTGALAGMFRRAGQLVHTPLVGEDGYAEPKDGGDGPAKIHTVNGRYLVGHLSNHFDTYRLNQNGARTKAFFPSDAAGHAITLADEAPHLRTLRGVTHTPMARKDGTILTAPGYDEASGFLHLPTVDVPEVPAHPTAEQLAAATARLRGMVDEFKWDGEHDEANYFGLLITPLLRELCPPPYKLGCIMARQPGSGKSLLNQTIRDIHGGVFRSEMPHDDAELEKTIGSILSETTAPVVQFDNVTGVLRSSRLAGLLTSAEYSARILGSSNNTDLVNDRLWTVTGNNVTLGGDLVRRAIWVTIDPGMPDPQNRTGFKLNLPEYVVSHRGQILADLLTWVAGWRDAGQPAELRASDSYAHWSATVRGILEVAGVPGQFDHAESAQQTIGADDEGWSDFLTMARQLMGDRSWTVKELIDAGNTIETVDVLRDALPIELQDKAHRNGLPSIKTSLSHYIKFRKGRWSGGLAIQGAGQDRNKTARWTVKVYGE